MTEPVGVRSVDVLVVGGGMVGASLIAALRHHCPELSLALVETAVATPESPSFDGRASALAFGSRLLLQDWGLWSALADRVTPIDEIQVSDRGHFGTTRLRAPDEGVPALGYVLENRDLGQALQQYLQADEALCRHLGAAVTALQFHQDRVTVTLSDEQPLNARLLVLADGGRSALAQQLGIAQTVHGYGTQALVTWVEPRQAHANRAFERFTDEGPMALLPLAGQRMALVWTMDQAQAERRSQLDPAAFRAELEARFGDRLGRFVDSGPVSRYPLSLRQASEQVRSRLVVLGNAAHNLHPVAGQGFNLCLRDIDALARELQRGLAAHEALGALPRLQRYLARQQADQQRTRMASDLLARGFTSQQPLWTLARNLGLVGLDRCPPLKHVFARLAMGLEPL